MTRPVHERGNSHGAQFERGFKTWAETTSVNFRKSLSLKAIDPLDPTALAAHLQVRVWDLREIPGVPAETIQHLSSPEGDEWSALTVSLGLVDVIVINPSHSQARQCSNLAHELAHIIRKHKPTQVFISEQTGLFMRTYDALQEEEAKWLSGCLLLPRSALLYHASRGTSRQETCEHFGVSRDLLQYRLNMTGLHRQFAAA